MIQFINRSFTYLLCITLIAACGGGGGGGGGSESPQDSVYTDNSYKPLFNTFLPLTEGAVINYEDATNAAITSTISLNEDLSDSETDVYAITFTNAEEDPLPTFHFSSAPETVTLYGIDGPFEFEASGVEISINELRFDTPVTVFQQGETASEASVIASAQADIVIPGIFSGPVTLSDIEVAYSTSATLSSVDLDYGELPTISINVTAQINYTLVVPFFDDIEITDLELATNFNLAKGIGIVTNTGDFIEQPINNTIVSLENVPQTIWFQRNGTNDPTALNGMDTTFQTDSELILSTEYEIANLDEINENDWVQITEDSASNTYYIEMQYSDSMPSELTSIEVVFEDNSGERMSGNVTLL